MTRKEIAAPRLAMTNKVDSRSILSGQNGAGHSFPLSMEVIVSNSFLVSGITERRVCLMSAMSSRNLFY